METQNKKHRPTKSGPKANKDEKNVDNKVHHNPKAFAVQHTTKAARMVQRTLDHQTHKHNLPRHTNISEVDPPLVVALVGPPKSGKSTLLRSLVKHFGRQNISSIKGPLTVVVGKKMRLTFIECGCDINSMLDASKIADVVLLMVNVRVGLEMYHFEFINMMESHGMPRVIPVLNHLDTYKNSAASKAARKKIRHRLWTDLNSKIFLLSRFQPKKYPATTTSSSDEYSQPGEYLLAEVRRLARMIIVKVPRSTDWRTAHPYLLIDRLEDITESDKLAQNPFTDRTLSLYGWVRGAALPPALTSPGLHIAGLGDLTIADCMRQPDPCPLPCQLAALRSSASNDDKPARHLSERDKKIYAPMSSLGGVLFDRDATYIDLGGSHYLSGGHGRRQQSRTYGGDFPRALTEMHDVLDQKGGLDEQLEQSHRIRLTDDTPFLLGDEIGNTDNEESVTSTESDAPIEKMDVSDECVNSSTEDQNDVKIFSDEPFAGFLLPAGSQNVDQTDAAPREAIPVRSGQKGNLVHNDVKKLLDVVNIHRFPSTPTQPLAAPTSSTLSDFTTPYSTSYLPSSTLMSTNFTPQDIDSPLLTNRFTTGSWAANEDAETLLAVDSEARAKLEAHRKEQVASSSSASIQHKPAMEEEAWSDDDDQLMMPDDDLDSDDASSDDSGVEDQEELGDDEIDVDPADEYEKRLLRPTKRQKLLEKRQRHKQLFQKLYEAAGGGSDVNAFYDKLKSARENQQAINKKILDSLPVDAVERLEGFPPGAYVRLEIKGVPPQFVHNFDPTQPLVVGGISSAEESKGYLQLRFRAHRWLKRTLRSGDPMTISIGWFRYQTVCTFSKEEHNLRNRFLKYALPHEHCLATVYGPMVPVQTGAIAFINAAWRPETTNKAGFRVAGTGSVTGANQSFKVMKKLKLVGEPYKIFSKTAFIRGMFNSEMEVSKMIGARVQSVSSVRGLIKAALTNSASSKPGDFRATFEAQIRKSDLIFLRTFVGVDLPRYCNPVLNRLFPVQSTSHDEGDTGQSWRLMKTLGELRHSNSTGSADKTPTNSDSLYKPIVRQPFAPAPLYVPTKLVGQLPFAHRPKPPKSRKAALAAGLEPVHHDPVRQSLANLDLPDEVTSIHQQGIGGETRRELLERMRLLHADFKARQSNRKVKRAAEFNKQQAKRNAKAEAGHRSRRKAFFARGGGGGGGRRGRGPRGGGGRDD